MSRTLGGFWVGGWVGENANSAIFQLYHCEEMVMRSAMYWTNTLSWIFLIVLAH